MPLFHYKSFNRTGNPVNGILDAPSVQSVKEHLRNKNLLPVSIAEANEATSSWFNISLFDRGIQFKDKLLFTKQLSVLLSSKIPLLKSIELLLEQFDGQFKRILIDVKDSIKEGSSFTQALRRYPKIFPNFYSQLVFAGEVSGNLELIMERLAIYLEKEETSQKKISGAATYPLFLLSFTVLIVVGILIFVIPPLASMFTQMGAELPLPTQLLMDLSDFFINHWMSLGIGLTATIASLTIWQTTQHGKYYWDWLLLSIPGVAYFAKTRAITQFCKTLGILLESGPNLSDSLSVVVDIIDNNTLKQQLTAAKQNIIKEGKIAKYLKDTGIFPNIATYMIHMGEESGNLAKMLTTIGNDYEVELDETTEKLIGAINPIMMMVVGFFVVFLAMAIMLPMMNMGTMINF